MERREYSPPPPPPLLAAAKIESFTCRELLPTPRKKKNKNKRRFSDEQVKLLESMFESETKLEPRNKVQLARELGLQPRQVAIWFQNKRARWKAKQIEREYRILRANYDNLSSRFESLKNEKQSLHLQLQKLSDLLEQPHDMSKDSNGLTGNSTDGCSDTNCEYEVNPDCLQQRLVMDLDDDNSKNIGFTGLEEVPKLMNIGELEDGNSLESPEKWCRDVNDEFELCDQSYSDSHWWDFWSS